MVGIPVEMLLGDGDYGIFVAFLWHLNGIFMAIFSFPTECPTVSSPICFDDFPAMSKIMDDTNSRSWRPRPMTPQPLGRAVESAINRTHAVPKHQADQAVVINDD